MKKFQGYRSTVKAIITLRHIFPAVVKEQSPFQVAILAAAEALANPEEQILENIELEKTCSHTFVDPAMDTNYISFL